ncbi:hypothetical protein SDC9_148582 [bioreactor metagenome]|uniref:Uncharacterized protein n=1 Tax=bioreactor metagenome TaxID=1076179 RepID=A0A645ELF8_9ZZZZ
MLLEERHGNSRAVFKALKLRQVNRRELFGKDVGEAALGDTAIQGHLAAFKSGGFSAAGAGLGTFVTLA